MRAVMCKNNPMREERLQVTLGGVRGSVPVSHPDFVRYGGATTSVLVDAGNAGCLVLDAGTGIRSFHERLAVAGAAQPVLLLLTHFHMDHLIGLPAFAPLYDPAWRVLLAAPLCGGMSAGRAVRRLVGPPFWPVRIGARVRNVTLPVPCGTVPFRHGPFDVRWCAVHHTGGCYAYRVDVRDTGASLVFATDVEWGGSRARERAALLRLCRTPKPADVLIFEGPDDGKSRAGWGHSAWQDAVQVAQTTGAGLLVVTHFSPDDDDATLARREKRLRAVLPQARFGRQGMRMIWKADGNTPRIVV